MKKINYWFGASCFIILLLAVFCVDQSVKLNSITKRVTATGNYASESSALILNIVADQKKYEVYDQHKELSDIYKAEGSYGNLDEETLLFESGLMKGSIIVLNQEGAKFIYTFNESKTFHTFDLVKKGSDRISFGN